MKEFDKYLIIFTVMTMLAVTALIGCETLKDWDFSFDNKTADGEVVKIQKKGDCLITQVFDNENKTCVVRK